MTNLEKLSNKSIARGFFVETLADDGVFILTHQNETQDVKVIEREIDSRYIQFHFCVKGDAQFLFNNGNYTINLAEETSLLLYNPQRDLPIHLEVKPHSWLVSVIISIKKFHGLFSQEANYITFLSEDNRDKKYYKDGKISPSMAIALNQLVNYNLNHSIRNIYFKAKGVTVWRLLCQKLVALKLYQELETFDGGFWGTKGWNACFIDASPHTGHIATAQ